MSAHDPANIHVMKRDRLRSNRSRRPRLIGGESACYWETGEWLAPVNFLVSKIVKVGGQPVSIVGGVRYWIQNSPDTGPHGFGGRLGMTFLFPAR